MESRRHWFGSKPGWHHRDANETNFYPCLKDNTVMFSKDLSGTIDEGAMKCYPYDPQTSAFNWMFDDGSASLFISGSSASVSFIHGKTAIIKLAEAKLLLSKDTSIGGLTGPVIVKLKH